MAVSAPKGRQFAVLAGRPSVLEKRIEIAAPEHSLVIGEVPRAEPDFVMRFIDDKHVYYGSPQQQVRALDIEAGKWVEFYATPKAIEVLLGRGPHSDVVAATQAALAVDLDTWKQVPRLVTSCR